MKRIIYILCLLLASACISAQELNVQLNINTQQVNTVDKQQMTSLEESVKKLMGEQRWTAVNMKRTERIDCIVVIAVKEMPSESNFTCDLQLTMRRPVYNSTYITSTLNFKDSQFDFTYMNGETLDYSEQNLNNNLIATLAFYSYVMIGLDFDSFSDNGGRAYFAKAMEIANSAQSNGVAGWKPFSGKMNRYDLAVALTDDASKEFHTMWYKYHRLGLDVMESNANRGRLTIIESLNELEILHKARPQSILLTLFAEAKLDEVVRICMDSPADEKKKVRELLVKIFPAKSNIINKLK